MRHREIRRLVTQSSSLERSRRLSTPLKLLALVSLPFASGQAIPAIPWISTIADSSISSLATDKSGDIYAVGYTVSFTFPVSQNAFETTLAQNGLYLQGFLVKLDSTGSKVLYGTYLNGLNPQKVVVDDADSIYILADHAEVQPIDVAFYSPPSFPFPVSPNAVQTAPSGSSTLMLVKFSSSGELIYSTFVGGQSGSPAVYLQGAHVGNIVVDSRGAITFCSSTLGDDLPTATASFQRFNRGYWNAYIARISPDGTSYEALTYLGGHGSEFCDDVKINEEGFVYAFGYANSRSFPVTSGAYDTTAPIDGGLIVAKLAPNLGSLVWSTYVNGTSAAFLSLNPDQSVTLAGTTGVASTPGSGEIIYPYAGPVNNPFIAKLSSDGSSMIFTQVIPMMGQFWQGTSAPNGLVYLAGAGTFGDVGKNSTLNASSPAPEPNVSFVLRFDTGSQLITHLSAAQSVNMFGPFAVIPTAAQTLLVGGTQDPILTFSGITMNTFGGRPLSGYQSSLAPLDFSGEHLPLICKAVNPATSSGYAISAGELIEIRGLGLGPDQAVRYDPSTGPPPLTLSGTRLLIDQNSVPVVSTESTRVSAVVPMSFSQGNKPTIVVEYNGQQSDPRTVTVASASPALFTASNTGTGQVLATNDDGTYNSTQHPSKRGSVVHLFATGLGSDAGSGNTAVVLASMDGLSATVSAILPAVGYPPGYFQIDVTVPQGVPEGDFVLVQLQVSGALTQSGTTLSVR